MKSITHCLSAVLDCLVLVTLLSFTISCQDRKEKEVFEKPAVERIQQGINSLHEKLKSSPNGWTLIYKPSEGETGYYQFLFRFKNDTEVETASDFSSEDLTLQKSEYSILVGSTTKLSFATKNSIHKLSDSNFSPIPGKQGAGLKGDFEFLYYGENAQGDLVFRTNRTNKTILFKKAADNSLKDIELSYANFEKLSQEKTVYHSLSEYKDGKVIKSSFGLPYDARVTKIRGMVKKETEGETTGSLDAGYLTGYGLTSEGIVLDSVKRNNGEILKNVSFKYNKTEDRFETMLGDGTRLSIEYSNSPIIPVNGQKDFLNPKLTSYLFYSHKDENIGWLTTAAFEALMEKVKPIGLTAGFGLYRQFLYSERKIDYVSLVGTASVSNGNVRPLLVYEDKGDRLVITQNGYRDPKSAIKPANQARYNEFMNFLTDPQGFYVEDLGKITRYSNHIFTFTSVKNPSMRFALYQFSP